MRKRWLVLQGPYNGEQWLSNILVSHFSKKTTYKQFGIDVKITNLKPNNHTQLKNILCKWALTSSDAVSFQLDSKEIFKNIKKKIYYFDSFVLDNTSHLKNYINMQWTYYYAKKRHSVSIYYINFNTSQREISNIMRKHHVSLCSKSILNTVSNTLCKCFQVSKNQNFRQFLKISS